MSELVVPTLNEFREFVESICRDGDSKVLAEKSLREAGLLEKSAKLVQVKGLSRALDVERNDGQRVFLENSRKRKLGASQDVTTSSAEKTRAVGKLYSRVNNEGEDDLDIVEAPPRENIVTTLTSAQRARKSKQMFPDYKPQEKTRSKLMSLLAADTQRRAAVEQHMIQQATQDESIRKTRTNFGIAMCAQCHHLYDQTDEENGDKACFFHTGM